MIAALTGRRPALVIVNTRNGASLPFLDPDDVVEVPAHIDGGGVAPLACGTLPRSARGLVTQVKEYEREVVSAAVTGDAERAALALALHPLVPGVTVAREMMSEYRERHGPDLAYLHSAGPGGDPPEPPAGSRPRLLRHGAGRPVSGPPGGQAPSRGRGGGVKLAVVGGGSTYTPELVDGIARLSGDVAVEELVLVDPDETRLAVVGPFSDRLMRAHGHPGQADLDHQPRRGPGRRRRGAAATAGRRPGGAASRRDLAAGVRLHRPGDHRRRRVCKSSPYRARGPGHCRTIAPACPGLRMDHRFHQPVGIVTRALLDAGHRAIGLCNVAIGFQRNFAALLGVDPSR